VRILAATNGNLAKLVANEEFREDLYYRINVLHIHLPPLRERKEDVLLLAEHFLRYYGKKFNKPLVSLSSEVKDMLKNYSWPGNVRELKNVIERAVVLAEGTSVEKDHLPFNMCMPQAEFLTRTDTFSLRSVMDDYERKVILSVLERTEWNQTKTAEILGIHRNTLLLKLDSLGIKVKQLKEERSSKVLV
jgi:two-component system response regulator AtoC